MKSNLTPILSILGMTSTVAAVVIPPAQRRQQDCAVPIIVNAPLNFDQTSTIYTKTVTVTEQVNCGTCNAVTPTILLLGDPGPAIQITATITATDSLRLTSYVCSHIATAAVSHEKRQKYTLPVQQPTLLTKRSPPPSPTPTPMTTTSHALYAAPPFKIYTAHLTPSALSSPMCQSSTQVDPEIAQSTLTVYPSTVTSTTSVACGGCDLVWSTGVIHYFAPITYTSTVTVGEPSTKVEFACLVEKTVTPVKASA